MQSSKRLSCNVTGEGMGTCMFLGVYGKRWVQLVSPQEEIDCLG